MDAPRTFLDLVRARRSCRAYRPDPVPRAHLEAMLEAARLAPSACNRQPWRFVVVTDAGVRAALASRGLLPGLRAAWVAAAPALIAMGLERTTVTHRIAPMFSGVDYPLLDLGIAGEHLVLAAADLGLGTCWIGWIRPRAVRRIVGWPRGVKPVAIFTVGYPAGGEADTVRPRLDADRIARWV
jgi:nitroreductase